MVNKIIYEKFWVVLFIGFLFQTKVIDAVILEPVNVSRLYSFSDSLQSKGPGGGYWGEGIYDEQNWSVLSGPLNNPKTSAEDDPIDTTLDGWTLDGLSSFAIARSGMVDSVGWAITDHLDSYELFVNNQATQDPPQYKFRPEGWGYSVSYLLVNYNTMPSPGEVSGGPMNILLNVDFSGYLYAGSTNDDYLLDIGYSLGKGLMDYNPVLDDPANQPNPGLSQFQKYYHWRNGIGNPKDENIYFSDSIQYNGVIGDKVGLLMSASSFSYSWLGYTWTDGTLNADAISSYPVIPEPATMLLFGAGLFGTVCFRRKKING